MICCLSLAQLKILWLWRQRINLCRHSEAIWFGVSRTGYRACSISTAHCPECISMLLRHNDRKTQRKRQSTMGCARDSRLCSSDSGHAIVNLSVFNSIKRISEGGSCSSSLRYYYWASKSKASGFSPSSRWMSRCPHVRGCCWVRAGAQRADGRLVRL